MAGENDFDDYVDSVSDITAPAAAGGDNGNTGTIDNPPANDAAQGNDQDTQDTSNADGSSSQEGSQQQSEQDGQVSQKPQLERHVAGGFVDKSTGNIVDEQGRILAKAGPARRLYEEKARVTYQNTQLTTELDRTKRELQAVQFLNGIPQQHGLSPQEVAEGLDIVARMKRGDVVGVTKDLVAKMVAKGHNVSELLGKEVGDSVDMKALSLMIDQRLAPITERETNSRQMAEAQQAALNKYNQFIDEHEYADTHGDDIVALVRDRGLSHEKAYWSLREYAVKNQLDFTRPLRPQIEARMQADQTQQTQQRVDPRPLPGNGARTRPNGVTPPANTFASADDSWASIIQQTMAEN